jgi:hypothetical protein
MWRGATSVLVCCASKRGHSVRAPRFSMRQISPRPFLKRTHRRYLHANGERIGRDAVDHQRLMRCGVFMFNWCWRIDRFNRVLANPPSR